MSNEIKISNGLTLDSLDATYVKRTDAEMAAREEYNSLLWNKVGKNFFETPARDLKIGEDIYNIDGSYIGYRTK